MLPEAHLCHDAYGRTRFRIPSKRGDGVFFSSVREHLLAEKGVKAVETNPATASLLILHSGNAKSLAEAAEKEGLFTLAAAPAPVVASNSISLGRFLAGKVGAWDIQLKETTRGAADLRTVMSLTLAGLGLFQASRGNYLAPASTLLSDALRVSAVV